MDEHLITVSLDQLILATDNPRHEEVEDEGAAIERLCATESIDTLAADIAEYGINPAERLIIYPFDEEDEERDEESVFVVAEGNRRVCALKLLNDPDLSPSTIRRRIRSCSKSWEQIQEIEAVVIADEVRRRHWLSRIHDGAQKGRGRIQWKAEQKTRFTGGGRNAISQALLDYCEDTGLITRAQRAGRISHLARLLSNPLVRNALGLVTDGGPEELRRNRPKGDFDTILKEILNETEVKGLGSQAPKRDIDRYAHKLETLDGVSSRRLDTPELLRDEDAVDDPSDDPGEDGESEDEGGRSGFRSAKPTKPKPPRRSSNLEYSEKNAAALEEYNSEKLTHLYWSICFLSAKKHTPLVSVGVWSFLESLSACTGRPDAQPFKDFWATKRIVSLGIADKGPAKSIHDALERLANAGNTTKHHATSAHFDSNQLINDWKTIGPLIDHAISAL